MAGEGEGHDALGNNFPMEILMYKMGLTGDSLSRKIFSFLDFKSLKNCRLVSVDWCHFLNVNRRLWLNILQPFKDKIFEAFQKNELHVRRKVQERISSLREEGNEDELVIFPSNMAHESYDRLSFMAEIFFVFSESKLNIWMDLFTALEKKGSTAHIICIIDEIRVKRRVFKYCIFFNGCKVINIATPFELVQTEFQKPEIGLKLLQTIDELWFDIPLNDEPKYLLMWAMDYMPNEPLEEVYDFLLKR